MFRVYLRGFIVWGVTKMRQTVWISYWRTNMSCPKRNFFYNTGERLNLSRNLLRQVSRFINFPKTTLLNNLIWKNLLAQKTFHTQNNYWVGTYNRHFSNTFVHLTALTWIELLFFFSEILSGVCFNNNNNKKEDERKNKGKWNGCNRLTNYFCYSISSHIQGDVSANV